MTPWTRTVVSGIDLLRNPKYNKGMNFSSKERDELFLTGLMPHGHWSQEVQVERVLANLDAMEDPLAKYSYMCGLQERNERLFFRVVMDNIEEMMPIIYSRNVSKACEKYGLLFRRPRGLFIGINDAGNILKILKNWTERRVKVICVSDGQNTLGLGDQGIQGMGNLVGKVNLLTACGGLHPSDCLPVSIDVGTDNEKLLNDKFYLGLRHSRVTGDAYENLMEEFMDAVRRRFGNRVLVSVTSMTEENSVHMNKYASSHCVYNDDTQGVAASTLAALYASERVTGKKVSDHTILLAGESGLLPDVPDLLTTAISKETRQMIHEARRKVWLFTGKGLVVRSRESTLSDKCLPFAQKDFPETPSLLQAVRKLKPSVLIGAASTPMKFEKEIIEEVAKHHERPIIGGPDEVTRKEVMEWTNGRALFVPGVPGGEAYISPGLSLGLLLSGCTSLREDLFVASAKAVASSMTDDDFSKGNLFPDLKNIRNVSAAVALKVITKAYELGIATNLPRPDDLKETIESYMYQPLYRRFR